MVAVSTNSFDIVIYMRVCLDRREGRLQRVVAAVAIEDSYGEEFARSLNEFWKGKWYLTDGCFDSQARYFALEKSQFSEIHENL